ncbi:protein of unknown function [Hyphomicrobium sp. MC1]|nr:protein of unknown function [Hyphomicrobium sp. MC1]
MPTAIEVAIIANVMAKARVMVSSPLSLLPSELYEEMSSYSANCAHKEGLSIPMMYCRHSVAS